MKAATVWPTEKWCHPKDYNVILAIDSKTNKIVSVHNKGGDIIYEYLCGNLPANIILEKRKYKRFINRKIKK
jgi:hypothetical protein